MAWRLGDSRQVAGRLTDEKIWRELSLGLLINRHCAECIDDDEVSRELRRVWKEQRHLLPWSLS
jgi:hypothetical protein